MGGGTIFRFYGGDTAVMRGDIELMGRIPPVPPTRENPIYCCIEVGLFGTFPMDWSFR